MPLKIGDLAKATDTQVVTIRYYEKEGLLRQPERSDSGYRLYSETDVERLHFIRRCRQHGMSLGEIRALLAFRDSPTSSCDWINFLVEKHIAEVEQQIESLQLLKSHLETLRRSCGGDHAHGCGIIAQLDRDTPCPSCNGLHCRLAPGSSVPSR
ncbi:MAG: Cd(II)/Pb(II)-responsive transcriptional regulator [Mailhella sp.]|nr:Cd(II)/Pb(II)-responsive transcriptional regulator [Mailhella sp.]